MHRQLLPYTALFISSLLIATGSAQLRQPAASNPATQTAPAARTAQQKAAANQQQAQQKVAAKPATEADFKMPVGVDTTKIVDYLADMITYAPQTQADAELYQKVAPVEMNKAAQLVLKQEKDRSSDNYKFAYKYLMAVEAMTIEKATPERRKQFFQHVTAMLQSPEMDSDDLDIAVTFAEGLEIAGDTKMATQAYLKFADVLGKKKDPLAAELSKLMAGAARRLNLIGNPIQVVGTTTDGKPLDWKQYRGRVVLVDFWATWCGPCLHELPNIRKMHDAYRDKGFEVVGISMDEDRERLEQFLEKNPMPWPTLHEESGMNPTAVHYGISTLPATLLIDKQGNVITLEARGDQLEAQLARLLGPITR